MSPLTNQCVSNTKSINQLGFKPFESTTSDSLYIQLNHSPKHYHFNQSIYTLINDGSISVYSDNDINTDIVRVTEDYNTTISSKSSAHFPLFLHHQNKIRIPKKVRFALARHTPRQLLRDIHPDIDVAIELCLLYVSLLSSTYFGATADNPQGWKPLKAEYLRDFLLVDTITYRKVRLALEYPLKKGAILVCDNLSITGSKSFHHRLGDSYFKKGIETYQVKTPTAIRLLNKRFLTSYRMAITNPICQNLIELYPLLTLPSELEILERAKELVKQKYITPKGKRLVFRNKHPNSYFKNPDQLSFVEDALEVYRYLTNDGLMIPTEGSSESGGRIVDSFTLMPSWIRKMVKINGVAAADLDYSCLHPNLAVRIYGGQTEFLTHQMVADAIHMDLSMVKNEHLSFFNKKLWQMKASPLYTFYEREESVMLRRLMDEKKSSRYRHRVTSRKMFELEVQIMTEVIRKLNSEGVYVGYVYDALFCHPMDAARVKQVMDDTIRTFGVRTTAKLSLPNQLDLDEAAPSIEVAPETAPLELRVVSVSSLNHNSAIRGQLLSTSSDELRFEDVLIDFNDGMELLPAAVTVIHDEFQPEKCFMTKRFLFAEN